MKPWRWKQIADIATGAVISTKFLQPHRVIGIYTKSDVSIHDRKEYNVDRALLTEPYIEQSKVDKGVSRLYLLSLLSQDPESRDKTGAIQIRGHFHWRKTVLRVDPHSLNVESDENPIPFGGKTVNPQSIHIDLKDIQFNDWILYRDFLLGAVEPYTRLLNTRNGIVVKGWKFSDIDGKHSLKLDDGTPWQDYSWLPHWREGSAQAN